MIACVLYNGDVHVRIGRGGTRQFGFSENKNVQRDENRAEMVAIFGFTENKNYCWVIGNRKKFFLTIFPFEKSVVYLHCREREYGSRHNRLLWASRTQDPPGTHHARPAAPHMPPPCFRPYLLVEPLPSLLVPFGSGSYFLLHHLPY